MKCAITFIFGLAITFPCVERTWAGTQAPAAAPEEIAILTDFAGTVTVLRGGKPPAISAEPLLSLFAQDTLVLAGDTPKAIVVFNTGQVANLDALGRYIVASRAITRTQPTAGTVPLRGVFAQQASTGAVLADTLRLTRLADTPVTRRDTDAINLGVPYRDILSDRPTFRWTSTLPDTAFTLTILADDQRTVVQKVEVRGLTLAWPPEWPAFTRDRTYYWSVASRDGKNTTNRRDFTVAPADEASRVDKAIANIRTSFGTTLTALNLITDHLIARELYADALPYAEEQARRAPKNRRALLTLKAVYKALEMRAEAEAVDTPPSTPTTPLDEVRHLLDGGQFEDARALIDRLERDWTADTTPERRVDLARLFKFRGILYDHLGTGTTDDAQKCYEHALMLLDHVPPALRREADLEKSHVENDLGALVLRLGEDKALDRVPDLFGALQQYRAALRHFEAALTLAGDDRASAADAHSNLGAFYRSFGDFYLLIRQEPAFAEKHYDCALTEHRTALDLEHALATPRPINVGRNELGLGNVLLRRGQNADARAAFARAAAAFDDPAERSYSGLESAHRNLGLAYLPDAKDRAISELRIAAAMGEHLRGETAPGLAGRLRASLFSDRVYVHEKLVELLVERGDIEAALAYAEEAKARAFLDLIQAPGKEIGDRRRETGKGSGFGDSASLALPVQGSGKTEDRRQNPESRMKNSASLGPRTEDLGPDALPPASSPLSPVASLTDIRAAMDDQTALVEYLVGRDAAFVFVLFRGRLSAERLNVNPADLVRKVILCRQTINDAGYTRTAASGGSSSSAAARSIDPLWQDQLADLYVLLVAPVRSRLDGAKRLIIVPHHVLHYVPFAALVAGPEKNPPANRFPHPRFLVEAPFDIAVAPSASAFVYAQRRSAAFPVAPDPQKALIFANAVYTGNWPALPGAEREARAVAPLFDSKLLVGQDATRAAFLTGAADCDILYLATHGKLEPTAPLQSCLILTAGPKDDGLVHVSDLFTTFSAARPLKARLVVLSACQSGLSDPNPAAGDDLVCLSRAFMAAGATSVISTLWNVSDRASATLVIGFFTSFRAGTSKIKALCDTQRAMISEARAKQPLADRDIHPFYWAPFTLTGEWR